ncbi:alpha-ketoglutarate-dependent dioxygenase AlkB family protein [Stappia indica]|uniref:alpha-ketoglutarate-dependent dioxygenase AlkB family protein n=1 Tax=Stappia indica TaxID=538381 RepID=UPI001D198969|nr:alpha-ketoglutarate-dependent dioxygenase AlkB [Stappia indica]MCC4246705.1 alpha-ketoglutarate-dependent dioxygenase AlkB [Stappia indica]
MQDDHSQKTGSRSAASPPAGFRLLPGRFDRAMQQALLEEIRAVVAAAPLFTPVMPRTGTPFSVRMTNCGPLGWVSDRAGYRYQPLHPVTGKAWPAMPPRLLDLWQELAPDAPAPEACLVNFYGPKARMGLHQDKDEATFEAPVVSVSLGATAVFRLGGRSRKDPTRSFRLASGDVLVLGGEARLAHHGIDRLVPGTSTLVRDDGRINLTLRRVTPG